MAEILKERSELDPQFQWDLTPMFESDAAWETALENLDAEIDSVAAFAGKLLLTPAESFPVLFDSVFNHKKAPPPVCAGRVSWIIVF